MSLVGEAGLKRQIYGRLIPPEALAGELQAPHERVRIGACAKPRSELPGEFESRKAAGGFQLRGVHDAVVRRVEESSRPLEPGQIQPQNSRGTTGPLGFFDQCFREPQDNGINRKRLQFAGERGLDRVSQRSAIQHRFVHKGQRTWTPRDHAARLGNSRRVDVDDPVAESFLRPGIAIVRLIGVQDHDFPGCTPVYRAPVAERLYARIGETDRVGVVAVSGKCGAGEPCAQQLYAARRPTASDPVGAARLARSFKTRATRPDFLASHGAHFTGSLIRNRQGLIFMSYEQAQAFVVFAVVAAITPGPSNVMLTAT